MNSKGTAQNFTAAIAVSVFAVLLLSFIFPEEIAATADNKTVGEQTAQPDTSSQPPAPAAAPALKGRVHGTRLLGRDMLGHIGSTTESLKKTCLVVMNELAMPVAITGTGPNIVGTTVIPSMPAPSGLAYIGHEDPHPAAVSAAINTLIGYAKHLEDELSVAVVPADTPEYAKELWDKIREISEKLYVDLNDLVRLARSEGATYETTRMEKLTLRIYDKSEAINKLRRRIANELRKQKS